MKSNLKINVQKSRATVSTDRFFIKAFRISGFWDRIRNLAHKEWKIARHLAKQGELSPEPVICRKGEKWDFFVAYRLKKAVTLSTFFASNWNYLEFSEKREVLKAFAHFVYSVWECGLFQPDFHLDNVLYDRVRNKFYIVDLHRAKLFDKPLSACQRLENLTYILPPLLGNLDFKELASFYKNLKKFDSAIANLGRNELRTIIKKSYVRKRRQWSRKTIRKLKEGISRFSKGNIKGLCIASDFDVYDLVTKVDHLLERGQVIKNSRTTKAGIVYYNKRRYFLKRFNNKGVVYTIRYLIKPSRSIKAFEKALIIQSRGIACPLPLMAFEVRLSRVLRKAYLLSEVLGPSLISLPNYLKGHKKSSLIRILKKMAVFVWEMHEKGIFHGDLKGSNIYVKIVQDNIAFWLIDFDGTKCTRNVSLLKRRKDIITLLASLKYTLPDLPCRVFLSRYSFLEGSDSYLNLDFGIEKRLEKIRNRRTCQAKSQQSWM